MSAISILVDVLCGFLLGGLATVFYISKLQQKHIEKSKEQTQKVMDKLRQEYEEYTRPKSAKEEILSRTWHRPLCLVEVGGERVVAAHCVCGKMHQDDEDLVLCREADGFILCHEGCVDNAPFAK